MISLRYKDRARTVPREFLKDFKGTIQTDDYAVYNYFEQEEQITLLICLKHARRKFEKSLSEAPEKDKSIFDNLKDFLIQEIGQASSPKSDMAKALNYTLKLWNRIIRYIEDGRWKI